MHFWHFFPNHETGMELTGSHDFGLVAISLAIAVLGGLAALPVVTRLRLVSSPRARRLWLAAGSVAMGCGIWAMHFTGMLAFDLPMPVTFSLLPTLVSVCPAVVGSAIALTAMVSNGPTHRSIQLSALAFAAAISTMHFVGMEAMHVEGATMGYDPRLFLLSVAVAYVLALAALYLRSTVEASRTAMTRRIPRVWMDPIAATVLGCAVAGMHYTAMAAATFISDPSAPPHPHIGAVSQTTMALAIAIAFALIAFLTILGVTVDRKLREAAQKISDDRLQHRIVTDSMRDGLIVVTDDDLIESLNPAAEAIFGYNPKELLGMRIDRIMPSAREELEALVNSHSDVEGLHKNGSPVSLQVTAHTMRVGRAAVTTLIVRARDEMEVLERHMRRLAAAVEYTDEAIAIVDVDLRVVYVNPGFVRQFRGNERRLLGSEACTAFGIDADSNAYRSIKDALGRTRVWQGRLVTTGRDGHERQIDVSISPVRNDINLVTNFVAFVRDITEQLTVEQQLHQAQRLESVGQLVAGVAHEISTPAQFVADDIRFLTENFVALLRTLRGYHELLQPGAAAKSRDEFHATARALDKSLDLDFIGTEIPRALAEAEEGVSRIANIVRAMKDFSHPDSGAPEPADINSAVRNTAIVCRNYCKQVAEIEFDLANDIPLVPCRIAQLNQVFLSLIANAADALADTAANNAKGRIVIGTRLVGDQVEITVRDNGRGIPERLAPRIFDPSFTTKSTGKSTGQGLAVSRDTVTKHGGTLTFDSLPGVATTFRLRIPLHPIAQAARRVS